jgi:hypothetical protein
MLRWIAIFGGLLLMMGQHSRSESLFYYFRLEDQVPENHLLRLIDRHVSFDFVREQLRDSYSETGRPSIDPELLLRILLGRFPSRCIPIDQTVMASEVEPPFVSAAENKGWLHSASLRSP